MAKIYYDSEAGLFRREPETLTEAKLYCRLLEEDIQERIREKDENARRYRSLIKKYKKLTNNGSLIRKFNLIRKALNYKDSYLLIGVIEDMLKELEDLGIIEPIKKKGVM